MDMKMKRIIGFLTGFVLCLSTAQAHFIWLAPGKVANGTSTIHVRFGEGADDGSPEFVARLKGMKIHHVVGDAEPKSLELVSAEEQLTAQASLKGGVVIASHDMGVFDRGDSVFRLKYYAKAGPAVAGGAWRRAKTADDLVLDIVPSLADGQVELKVRFQGKPVAGAQVVVFGPGLDDFEAETSKKGVAHFKPEERGIYSVRVRHIEASAGELQGKKYPETRHYCTIALKIPMSGSPVAKVLQGLPQPVTSFGAAVVRGSVYMYGGHTGSAHSYSKEEQSNQLTRLNLRTGKWSNLTEGPHLQGLALVAHRGTLYRIGGFTAKNAEGEKHKLVSQSSVARFRPAKNEWEELPPLPEARSSHDAAVVGDSIYVVGGWSMQDGEKTWHETAWKLDVAADDLKWESIAKPPFQRRALAAAAHAGRLYVLGGMQQKGGPTTAVAIYDPQNDVWSEGPSLFVKEEAAADGEPPRHSMSSGAMAGFGASAFATGGSLYVTTVQGMLLRLSEDGKQWEPVSSGITPRFFHRLLPVDRHRLVAVGGSNMSIGKFEKVEVIDVRPQE